MRPGSIANSALRCRCPYCHARPGHGCFSLSSGLPRRPHRARAAKIRRNPSLPPPGFLEGSKFKQPLFHGTFAPGISTGYFLQPDQGAEYGIYLSPSHRYARRYGPWLAKALVSIKRPLVVESKGEISPKDLTKSDVQRLELKGYDGIIVRSRGKPPSEVVAFQSPQVWVTEVGKS